MTNRATNLSTPAEWRAASRAQRAASAEALELPSGVTIRAARPAPLEWILAGRVPQRLLSAALATDAAAKAGAESELGREDVLEFARFATDLVRASVVEPAIGDGPDEIRFDDIPIEDRTFIFEWACRALRGPGATSAKEEASSSPVGELERFCAQ